MWLLFLIVLLLWAGGSYAPFSPYRGNNLVHLLLVVLFIILIYQVLIGGGLPRLGHWR
jgi:hypothetical protein